MWQLAVAGILLLACGWHSLLRRRSVTAAIAAVFVESQERRIEREILHDMHRQLKAVRDELRTLRAEITRKP